MLAQQITMAALSAADRYWVVHVLDAAAGLGTGARSTPPSSRLGADGQWTRSLAIRNCVWLLREQTWTQQHLLLPNPGKCAVTATFNTS